MHPKNNKIRADKVILCRLDTIGKVLIHNAGEKKILYQSPARFLYLIIRFQIHHHLIQQAIDEDLALRCAEKL